MAAKKIELKITAKDEASKVVENLAEKVEGVEKPEHELTLTAEDDATKVVEKVEGSAEQLTEADWTVEFGAKIDAAEGQLDRLDSELKDIRDSDYEATVDADVSPAIGELGKLERKSEGSTGKVSTDFRNLAGPIGGVTGEIGELGEAFETAAGIIGEQSGLSKESIGKIGTALGIVGIAVGTFWKIYQSEGERARKKLEEVKEAQLALAAGDTAAAVESFVKSNGKAFDILAKNGVSLQNAWKLLTGEVAITDENLKALGANDLPDEFQTVYLKSVAEMWKTNNKEIAVAQSRVFELAKAAGASTDEFLDMAKKALPEVRTQILKHVGAVEKIPALKMTEILTDANPDDLKQVKEALDELTKPRTVIVRTRALAGGRETAGESDPYQNRRPATSAAQDGPSRSVHVTVNAGMGANGADIGRKVVEEIRRYERRNGTGWRS